MWQIIITKWVKCYKVRQTLLQSALDIAKYVRYYKVWQTLLQGASDITKCDSYCEVWQTLLQGASDITKYDSYYKVRRNKWKWDFERLREKNSKSLEKYGVHQKRENRRCL